ncbi:MAG TPA: ROK family protein [Thermoplasmata archaeon]|nr:ROK family protein [Thermoplasmata archaeon]
MPRKELHDPPTAGVDFGGTKVEIAVVDHAGRVVSADRHPTAESRTPPRAVRRIAESLRELERVGGRKVSALGVGIAAQVRADGTILHAPNLRWSGVPLARRLRRVLRIPTLIVNDVQAVTFGEWKFGAGRGEADLLCVFVGTGVGGGLVVNGRLQRGAAGSAGEVGHLTIEVGGRLCTCGQRGHLEAYVGGWAIARRAQEAVRERPGAGRDLRRRAGSTAQITAETVAEAFHAGDRLAVRLVEETAEFLGVGLASAANLLGPGRIVLGGGVVDGIPELVAAVRPIVRRQALESASAHLSIVPSRLGKVAGVIGAAALAREILEPP